MSHFLNFALGSAMLLLPWGAAHGQSTCALTNPEAGVHICYPIGKQTEEVPSILHISAEINAPANATVSSFTVLVDNTPVGQQLERVPAQRISVEGNLGVPLLQGKHLLTIKAPGIGEATAEIVTGEPEAIVPCDPVTNFPQWDCVSRPPVRGAKEVSPFASLRVNRQNLDAVSVYAQYEKLVLGELEALQLDHMEVAAFDSAGNLYVATHAHSNIEVRKYTPRGQKLEFATVISSCGRGFTALDAMAVNDEGEIWIAGHSAACFRASDHAAEKESAALRGIMRAFVLSVSARPGKFPPLQFFTYLSGNAEDRITTLRIDAAGDAYVAGTTNSVDFPHNAELNINARTGSLQLSFVSVLKPDGSALLHSTLLRGATITALELRQSKVFIAGQTSASGFRSKSRPMSATAARVQASSPGNVCCSPFAAILPQDLSSITAATLLSDTPIALSRSLAITAAGEIVTTAAPVSIRSSSKGTSDRLLYAWSQGSRNRVCSQRMAGSLPPTLVNNPVLEAFAEGITSPICNRREKNVSP
jgi:hypothetical protein